MPPPPEQTQPGAAVAVRTAVADSAAVLHAAGVPSPLVDAELIVAYVLGGSRARLLTAPPLDARQSARVRELVAARATRRPLQHLLGSAPFWRGELAVGPGVFIPRPETELLVEWGLEAVRRIAAPVVVDLCAGSGAIAVTVATECPGAEVYAVERSTEALVWLRRNAAGGSRSASGGRAGPTSTAGDGVRVVAGDATAPATLAELDGRVDLVLCNPPYVPAGTPVDPEVADHDPAVAVFAGADGLAVIRPLVGRFAALLRPGGWLGVEHDDSHGEAVPALLRADGRFTDVADHPDLAGRPRFATARRLADCTS